jgi:hypothetical protein
MHHVFQRKLSARVISTSIRKNPFSKHNSTPMNPIMDFQNKTFNEQQSFMPTGTATLQAMRAII